MSFDPFEIDQPGMERRFQEILEPPDALAADLLRGFPEIGAYVGLSARAAEYQGKAGRLPVFRQGRLWLARKSELRAALSANGGNGS